MILQIQPAFSNGCSKKYGTPTTILSNTHTRRIWGRFTLQPFNIRETAQPTEFSKSRFSLNFVKIGLHPIRQILKLKLIFAFVKFMQKHKAFGRENMFLRMTLLII